MHADEVMIEDAVVRRLLSSQFPQWADQPLERLPDSGTDSAIYRLGDDHGVRLPRIHWAVRQIDRENEWLKRLAPELPVAIPVPVARGDPSEDYPYPWLIYPWLKGTSLDQLEQPATPDLVRQIAELVLALERVSAEGGPEPGNRGRAMADRDKATRVGIERLGDAIDAERALSVWNQALDAGPWEGESVWVHGDLLPANIIVDSGRLTGAIDWSGLGVGDPACDGMLAWALAHDTRAVFRQTLGFDDATWARSRGWVVEQTVHYIPYYEHTLPEAVEDARKRLTAALEG